MRAEPQVGFPVAPVEYDVRSVRPRRFQIEVYEERCHLCDVSYDSSIDNLMFGFQAVENRSKIRGVGHEPPIVLDIAILTNACRL